MSSHTKQWRINQFDYINKLLDNYKNIGIGNLENFPAALLHSIRKKLNDDIFFKVTNRNVLKRVLKAKGEDDLIDILPNQPILLLSNKNAFELYAKIKKNKQKSKAKVGMVSPCDIVIPEGDTGLPPGPALSDLKKVGIKAQVKGATISVPSDTVITKEGEIISSDVVSTLSKLDIKPVDLVLDVKGIKEDGTVYTKEVLDVDSKEIENNIIQAIRASINLGVEIVYPAKETIEPLIVKAQLAANALEKETSNEVSEKTEEKKE